MPDHVSARALIAGLADDFAEFDVPPPQDCAVDGPIGWPGYDKARTEAAERAGERESVVCGTGTIGGQRTVLIAFEFGFLGGSIGQRTGDLIEVAFTEARGRRLPAVSLIATGGSRMYEGMAALAQLQLLAGQSARTRHAGLPQITLLRDPTTGGGWATLGAGADVTIALAGAQIGFAGSRVRPPGDPDAYTAESQHTCGHVDRIATAEEVPGLLGRWLRLLTGRGDHHPELPRALGRADLPATGWDAVSRARDRARPRAESYLDAYFAWREELSGDRCGGRDTGVRCGFGHRDGVTVAYAAQCGTATEPAGFRTAARLVRLADRLGIPVLTLVDTPGAANGPGAERGGAGPAIAEMFAAIAEATVPITTLVIGEGGSGGALAFAAPGRTWVSPDGYFSVTSPEAAASILKRGTERVPETAQQLRLRPQDLVELGIANGIAAT